MTSQSVVVRPSRSGVAQLGARRAHNPEAAGSSPVPATITVGTDRPYPPSGLTSALWRRIPVRLVAYAELTTTQAHVAIAALLDPHRPPMSGDRYPHVIAWAGRLWLEDGHTRVTRALLRGDAEGLCRVHTPKEGQP